MQTTPKKGDTIATLTTNKGTIKMFFYTKLVPETTKNFLELAKAGKYDGSIFHRVIDGFMIQGGDFEKKNGMGGYSYKGKGTYLKDELVKGLSHLRGAVSMAKTAMPDTAGSQFFIVNAQEGTTFLDGKHSIFGFVYEGMDVVDAIAKAEKDAYDMPLKDIVIKSVEIGIYE
ncbi:MAG: peptidylprolyl isomerase [Candidatus Gracilibacteria bacterium]|jgi:cyclophilin family peptidyl-prolyl cis-trans isomerase